jgi:hypothetical protein
MESTQPARRATPTAAPEDRRDQERAAKEATDKEIAERLSTPPPPPTPTQAEADALKSGEALEEGDAQAREARQARDVKPAASGAGYTTR